MKSGWRASGLAALLRVAGREARLSSRLLVLLALGLVLLAYTMAKEFPDFRERILARGAHLPAFARKILAARQGEIKVESFAGFAYVHPVSLALMASWPIARAASAVAGEIERGSLGWHLAHPIGRTAFLWGKALVMLAGVGVLQLALFAAFQLSFAHFGIANAGVWPYANTALMGALLYAAVGSFTLWVSAASNRGATAGTAGSALVITGLILENIGGQGSPFEPYRWLSLYHYFDYQGLLAGHALGPRDIGVLAGVTLVCLLGATWQFRRRDLQI